MELGNLAQWFSVVATLLAVLVALFKDDILLRWKRPILAVSPIRPPHCHKLPIRYWIQRIAPTSVPTEGYFFRLWIENKGKTKADQVQVFASRLLRRAADGTFKEELGFLPMNLLWSHHAEEKQVVYETISAGMGRHCDLGRVIRPAERIECRDDFPGVPPEKTVLGLALEVRPSSLSHLLAPDIYRLELKIVASNAQPLIKTLEINHTGDWFDSPETMFTRGIGLRFIE